MTEEELKLKAERRGRRKSRRRFVPVGGTLAGVNARLQVSRGLARRRKLTA